MTVAHGGSVGLVVELAVAFVGLVALGLVLWNHERRGGPGWRERRGTQDESNRPGAPDE